jgi:hypothetical protein
MWCANESRPHHDILKLRRFKFNMVVLYLILIIRTYECNAITIEIQEEVQALTAPRASIHIL